MTKYKNYDYSQGRFIPIYFDKQILPGTFEHTLHYLIDNEIDLSLFDGRYRNDETGAPAYDPAILLKIILYAYSRGITSSRKIAECCRKNIIFMALSAESAPHFTTIADFISSVDEEIIRLFLEVVLMCDEMGLIGKEMFAVDGCKLPSNASKEWSGTKAEFTKKKEKMDQAIRKIVKRHKEMDTREQGTGFVEQEEQYVNTLRKEMMSSHGVIQGYGGVAVVDDKHQVIVHAEAFGKAQEHELLGPMIEGARKNLEGADGQQDVFKTDCRICEVRKKCLRNPERSETRQVYFFTGESKQGPETFTAKMKRKIDSIEGRLI